MQVQSIPVLRLCRAMALILWTVCGTASIAQADESAILDRYAVTVIPTKVLSDDPGHAELAGLVTEQLFGQLGAVEGLQVVDPRAVLLHLDASLSPVEIARQLGTASVIESSVSPGTDGVSIRVDVTEADTGKLVFSMGASQRRHRTTESSLESVREMVSETTRSVELHVYPDRQPDIADQYATARARFLDNTRTTEERLKALGEFSPPRNATYPPEYNDGGAALSGEVASAAVRMAVGSGDPRVKSRIWRTMIGVPDPVLVQPLTDSLANDANAFVRASAAEALAGHRDEPRARQALETARTTDPHEEVRKAAYFALLSRDELFAELRKSVVDDALPDMERRRALFRLMQVHREAALPVDDELVEKIVQIARTSRDADLRLTAWFCLEQLVGRDAAVYLMDALKTEPSEAVRESIVSLLAAFLDDPGVLEAVTDARSNDRSSLVRDRATRVLRGDDQ